MSLESWKIFVEPKRPQSCSFPFAVSQGHIKFYAKQQYCLTPECIEAGK